MSILQTKNLKKEFNSNILFEDVNFKVEQAEKVAIVGPNGIGKSTLLKMMAGLIPVDSGEIVKQANLKIGYLAQDALINSERSIYDEMKTVFKDILQDKKTAEQLEQKVSQLAQNDPQINELLEKHESIMQKFEKADGYAIDANIRKILAGFNFPESRFKETVDHLSGGEKSRLALAKILLEHPDLLFLDEPTNHLDLNTLNWLETYLKSYNSAIVMVSHDQYFLNQVTTRTFAFHHGKFHSYSGNYSFYLQESQKNDVEEEKHYEEQQKEIQKLETFVEKNITRASTTKRAQSKRKQLEKIEPLQAPDKREKKISLHFTTSKRSGNIVLVTKDLTVGYQDKILARDINIEVENGQKVAVIGPNGQGKSTLAKTLIGQIPPISGSFKIGANVSIGYYDQSFNQLDPDKTVIDQFWDEFPLLERGEVLKKLAGVLFTGDDLNLKIHSLSGGQKARLALVLLIEEQNNFLLLDEPTNHLDIDSKEVLEHALKQFSGTVLFISHDRYFINELADKTVEIGKDHSTTYLGNWDYYFNKQADNEIESTKKIINTKKPEKAQEENKAELSFEQQKELRRLKKELNGFEEIIAKNEKSLAELQKEAAKPENGYDLDKLNDLTNEIEKVETIINEAIDKWTEKTIEIEELNTSK